MADDDVIVGIDGSGAKRGADQVVAQLSRIEKSAASMSKRAGDRIQKLYDRIQMLSSVAVPAANKISAIAALGSAISALGSAKGPSAATVKNLQALFRALGGYKVPPGLYQISNLMRSLSGFKGPSATSVTNIRNLFNALKTLPGTAGLQKMLADLRLITQRLAPVAAALTRLQGAGGAAAKGLKQAGGAARSTHADFVGLRASSLSLGGALLRTGEFASALGAAFGLGAIAKEINTLQKTEATLLAVTGSMAQARKEMEFLSATARTFKVYVGDLSVGYAQFRIASEGLGLSLGDTQTLFRNVTQSVRVFNLSTEDAEGVFRALTQIASKGSLQMEELRGQLGDRMPVAVQAMANALGVSVGALAKMMEQGKVTGDVLKTGLIGFGEELKRMTDAGLLKSTQSLSASLGDLKTTFYEFANAAGNAGLTEFFQNVASGLQNIMTTGSPANSVLMTMGGILAFVSRNWEMLAVAIAAVALPKVIAGFASLVGIMRTATAAAIANTAATTANNAAGNSSIASLAILGSRRTLAASLTDLDTAAKAGNTVATYANMRAQGMLAASLSVVRGGLRALWLIMAANPLTTLLVAIGALTAGFFYLKDKMDLARQSAELYAKATDLASSSSLAAQSSIASLATEYYGLATAADTAALAMRQADNLAKLQEARTTRDTARANALAYSRNTRRVGVGDDLTTPEGIARALARSNEGLAKAGPGRTGMDRVTRGMNQGNYEQEYNSMLRSLAPAETVSRQLRLETDVAAETARLKNLGLKGGALGGAIGGYSQVRSRQLGLPIPLNEAPSSAIPNPPAEEKKKKGGGKSAAEREMERQAKAAERLMSRLDGVFDATNTMSESMESFGHIADNAFGSKTVEKAEFLRRMINDAFQEMGKLDIASNISAEWDDNNRMVAAYKKALQDAGIASQELVDRATLLTRLDFASKYEDALGPIGKMAGLVSSTEKRVQEMKAASDALSLSEEERALAVQSITDEYSKSAREIARNTREGQRLTTVFDNALNSASELADIMAEGFGSKSADAIRLQVKQMQKLAEAGSGMQGLNGRGQRSSSISGGNGATTVAENGVAQVAEVVVNASRANQVKILEAGQGAGAAYVTGMAEEMQQLSDERMLSVFKTITDVVTQGGAIGDMREYADAIETVTNSMKGFQGSTQALQQHKFVLDSLSFSLENMKADYYTAALEATKFGGVMNRSIDSAADAISEFIQNGTLDIGSFLRSVQADLIKTFVLTPFVNRIKETLATNMGAQKVGDAGSEANAAATALSAANMTSFAAQKFEAASMAQQQITVQEQAIVNALGLSVTTMSTATQNFDGTVSRLMSFISTLPGMGGAEILTNGTSGALQPLTAAVPAIATPYGDAAGGQAGGSAGNVAGAVNSALQQPSTLLTQAGTSMQTAAAQTITSALGLQGVGGQFVSSVIPGMLQSAFASLFGAQATTGAAGATAASATTSSL